MLANIVAGAHLLIVLFILLGVPLVYLGAALHWPWVRGWRWRILHLGAILFVAAESMLGITCPLTVWEDTLRGRRTADGFIERWIDRIIFYDAPVWVFTISLCCTGPRNVDIGAANSAPWPMNQRRNPPRNWASDSFITRPSTSHRSVESKQGAGGF